MTPGFLLLLFCFFFLPALIFCWVFEADIPGEGWISCKESLHGSYGGDVKVSASPDVWWDAET